MSTFGCVISVVIVFLILGFIRWITREDKYPHHAPLVSDGDFHGTEPEIQLYWEEYYRRKHEAEAKAGKGDPTSSYENYNGQWRTKGYANQARRWERAQEDGWKNTRDVLRDARKKAEEYDRARDEMNRRKGRNRWGEDYTDGETIDPKQLKPGRKK